MWYCNSTIEYLLYGFIAHLCRGEALQWNDWRVGSVTQQLSASLDVTGEGRPVQGCLSQCVHSVHLNTHTKGYDEGNFGFSKKTKNMKQQHCFNVFNTDKIFFFLSSKSAYQNDFWRIMWHWRLE